MLVWTGAGALALALLVTLAVLVIYMSGDDDPAGGDPRAETTPGATEIPLGAATETPAASPTPETTPTITPTLPPTITPLPTLPPVDWQHPTAAPDVIAAALDQPAYAGSVAPVQRDLEPLTILPDRARSDVISYTVRGGDNLGEIAKRFDLDESTIIWSNDSFYVNAMRVGLRLTILPVDGVYHRVQQPQSVADIAELYSVAPYTIIDSEYNELFGTVPETILPVGLYVVVPGGTGSKEPIYWDPGIVMTTTSSSGTSGSGAVAGASYASFAIGEPGSCGQQAVINGSLPVTAPIWRRYTITQDFTWAHGGIDLAVPEGTPVYAAGGGTVIFSGWSTWGYGYTVVLAHGGSLTLYGHLNGSFVSCGEVVEAGQNIAVTGNSGRSSGPHLHFEIRGSNGAPVNPWDYQSF